MAGVADRLLTKYQQGSVVLSREVVVEPPNPWEDPQVSWVDEQLKAVVRGVSAHIVGTQVSEGGPVLQATDLQVVCTPPVNYKPGDVMRIDGKAVHVLQVENIPGAGVIAAVRFYVRR